MRRILLIALALVITLASNAQEVTPVPVDISTEKVKMDGKTFYMHKVLAGQTIYSICKAYGTTNGELVEINPSLADGLKAGSLILIPVESKAAPADTAKVQPEPQLKWYQKLFKSKKEQKQEQTEVIAAADTASFESAQATEDEAGVPEDSALVQRVLYDAGRPAKIALVLPIKARSDNPSHQSLDFYSGALQALYRAEAEKSIYVTLSVFDDSELVQQGYGKISDSDLIICTETLDKIRPLAAFAAERSIPLVSAMDSKADSLLAGNPYFFQVPVNHEIQLKNLIASVDPSLNDRVYLFSDSRYPSSQYTTSVKNFLAENSIDNYTPVSYDILRGRELGIALGKQWSKNYTYKIIVSSEDAAFAPDVIRNLKMTGRYIPIEVYCSNKIRNYDSVDTDSFYLLNGHFSAPYFVDYTDYDTRDFVMKYRALFNTEPTAYSFQGFDILTYFLQVMQEEGNLFASNVSSHPMDLLQCSFNFVRSDEKSGWHNCATRDIIYSPDFTISIRK